MKKDNLYYVLWFFKRYNKELYIDYDILVEIISICKKELIQVIDFLKKVEEDFSTDYINDWYFTKYFPYRYYGKITDAFNLTEFLQYSVGEFEEFKEDIKLEIY